MGAATRVLTREYETPPPGGGVWREKREWCVECADTGLAGPRELMLHRLFDTTSQHTNS